MVAKGQSVSYDCDLHPAGSPDQGGCHYVRRGHRAIRVLMVLVDAYAVETELLGVLKFVEIAIVKKMPLLRIIVPVGQSHPGGRVFAFIVEVGGEFGPWHEVKEVELHRASCFRQRSK